MGLAKFYLVLLFSFLLFRSVNSLTKRSYHTAVRMNDRIYFLGGMTDTSQYTNDFFYLDVSVSFNINSLPFSSSSSSLPPIHRKAMSTVCNNNTIFLFGGEYQDVASNYVFKSDAVSWNPITSNATPARRKWAAGACDKNNMYVFGGSNDINGTATQYFNEFDILDISNTDQPNWSSANASFLPSRDIATATLLPDGRIVYLGGNLDDSGNNYAKLTEIPMYDTNKKEWSTMITSGYQPKARGLHTAALTNDGRIIVYGGEIAFDSLTPNGSSTPASDPLIVLDTTTNPFTWSQHNIPSPSSPAVYRGHTATMVGNYMFVAFGSSSNHDGGADFSDKINILDVSDRNNYKWITDFTPQNPQNPDNPSASSASPSSTSLPSSSPSDNKSMIGYIVGGVAAGLVVIAAIIILVYRRYRKQNKQNYLPTAGSERT